MGIISFVFVENFANALDAQILIHGILEKNYKDYKCVLQSDINAATNFITKRSLIHVLLMYNNFAPP